MNFEGKPMGDPIPDDNTIDLAAVAESGIQAGQPTKPEVVLPSAEVWKPKVGEKVHEFGTMDEIFTIVGVNVDGNPDMILVGDAQGSALLDKDGKPVVKNYRGFTPAGIVGVPQGLPEVGDADVEGNIPESGPGK